MDMNIDYDLYYQMQLLLDSLVQEPKPPLYARRSQLNQFEDNPAPSDNAHDNEEKQANQVRGNQKVSRPRKSANATASARSGQKEVCQFCKNNGEPEHVYSAHKMKDSRGRVVCLRLRSLKCPICGATGDNAHTKKYCAQRPILTTH